MTLQQGDTVQTPDGPGVVEDFELHPPLTSRMPTYYEQRQPVLPEGWFVRCGVRGSHVRIPVAYYPMDQINQDPQL